MNIKAKNEKNPWFKCIIAFSCRK